MAGLRITMPTGNIPESPELGTPRYNVNVGSQLCQLKRGSTVLVLFTSFSSTPVLSAPAAVGHFSSFIIKNQPIYLQH